MKKKGILLATAVASTMILAGCSQTSANDAGNAAIINRHLGIKQQQEAARKPTHTPQHATAKNERGSSAWAAGSNKSTKKGNSCKANKCKGQSCKAHQ